MYFYCNIASPYIIEEKTIKYIDYDLDLRVFPHGDYKVLDKMEYKYHKNLMNYSNDLDKVVNKSLEDLITLYENNYEVFNPELIYEYNKKYRALKK